MHCTVAPHACHSSYCTNLLATACLTQTHVVASNYHYHSSVVRRQPKYTTLAGVVILEDPLTHTPPPSDFNDMIRPTPPPVRFLYVILILAVFSIMYHMLQYDH